MGKLIPFITNEYAVRSFICRVPYAVISIASVELPDDYERVTLADDPNRVEALFMAFDDCSGDEAYLYEDQGVIMHPLTEEQARQIWDFFERVRDKITVLVVQCEAGISRSAAVAAALLEGSGLDSSYCYEGRIPNPYVKAVMLRVKREMLGVVVE